MGSRRRLLALGMRPGHRNQVDVVAERATPGEGDGPGHQAIDDGPAFSRSPSGRPCSMMPLLLESQELDAREFLASRAPTRRSLVQEAASTSTWWFPARRYTVCGPRRCPSTRGRASSDDRAGEEAPLFSSGLLETSEVHAGHPDRSFDSQSLYRRGHGASGQVGGSRSLVALGRDPTALGLRRDRSWPPRLRPDRGKPK
jgi:hypothetical protein